MEILESTGVGSRRFAVRFGPRRVLEGHEPLMNAEYWIRGLDLQPHPEGGYFRETYRADVQIREGCLGDEFAASRSVSTAIYYLLESSDFSAFHRIRSDEIWHHYAGSPLTIHLLLQDGSHQERHLASVLDGAACPQVVIPRATWFAATANEPASYALVGCTVAPGFDFEDFEIGRIHDLIREFPNHTQLIKNLIRARTTRDSA